MAGNDTFTTLHTRYIGEGKTVKRRWGGGRGVMEASNVSVLSKVFSRPFLVGRQTQTCVCFRFGPAAFILEQMAVVSRFFCLALPSSTVQ